MSLTSTEDVLNYTGAMASDFGFDSDDAFKAWIGKQILLVDNKIKALVRRNYSNPKAIPDLIEAELDWVFYRLLKRKSLQLYSSMDSGFAIGSLRIDNNSVPAKSLNGLMDITFKSVRRLIGKYCPDVIGQYLIVEDVN